MAAEGMHSTSAQASREATTSFRQFREQSEAERPFTPILGGPRLFILILYASVIVVAALQYFAGQDLWLGAWTIYNSYVFVVTGVFVFLGMVLLFSGKKLPDEETKLPVPKPYLAVTGLTLMVVDGLVLVAFGKSIEAWAVLASVLLVSGFVLVVFASSVIPRYDTSRLALFGIGLILMIFVPVHEAFFLWRTPDTQAFLVTLPNLILLVSGMVFALFGLQSIKTRDGFIGAWLMGAMAIFLLAFHEQAGIEIVNSGNYSQYDRTLAMIGIIFSFLPIAMYFWRERVYLYLWTRLKWANRLMDTGDYDGALKHTDAVLKQCARVGIEDRFALPWSMKADVLYRMRQYPKARMNYETALQIDPKDSVSWSNVGNMNAFEGKQEAALKAYDEALKADPKNPTVWNNKGVVYQSMGMYQEAMICFDKALGLDPDMFDAHINMAKLESKLGHSSESLRHYQRAFDLKPESTVAKEGVAKEFYRGMCLDQISGWESLGLDPAPLRQILEQDPGHFLLRAKEYLRGIVDRMTHIQTTPAKEHIDMDAAFKTILELVEPPGATIEELKEYTGLKERDLVLPIALLTETDRIYFETQYDRQVYIKKGKLPERPTPRERVSPPRAVVPTVPARDAGPPPSVYDYSKPKLKFTRPEPEPEAKKPEPVPEPEVEESTPPPPAPAPKQEAKAEVKPEAKPEIAPPTPATPAPIPQPKAEVAPQPPSPEPKPGPVKEAPVPIPILEKLKPSQVPVENPPVVPIACPGCGLTLHGDEKKCPRCDLPLEGATLDCPICGEEFEFSSPSCPKCGAVFRSGEPEPLIKAPAPQKPQKEPEPEAEPEAVAAPPEIERPEPKPAPPEKVKEKKPEPKRPPEVSEKKERAKAKGRPEKPAKPSKVVAEKKPAKSPSPEKELEEAMEDEEDEIRGLIERNVVTVEPTASMLVFTKRPATKPKQAPPPAKKEEKKKPQKAKPRPKKK